MAKLTERDFAQGIFEGIINTYDELTQREKDYLSNYYVENKVITKNTTVGEVRLDVFLTIKRHLGGRYYEN